MKFHKYLLFILWFFNFVLGASISYSGSVHVSGYMKSNGTYVAPYYRSSPDSSVSNNWSTVGNVNPYTGKIGTKNPYSTYQTSTSNGYYVPSSNYNTSYSSTSSSNNNQITDWVNKEYNKISARLLLEPFGINDLASVKLNNSKKENNAENFVNNGIYYLLRDYQKSKLLFQEALKIDKDNKKAIYGLALTSPADSEDILKSLLKKDTNNKASSVMLGMIYASSSSAKASQYYSVYERAHPDSYEIQMLLGRLHLNNGSYRQAITYFAKALKHKSDSALGNYELAKIYFNNSKPDSAVPYFKEFIRLDSTAAQMVIQK